MKNKFLFFFIGAWLSCYSIVAQTEFMPIGTKLSTHCTALGFNGTALFESEKDTIIGGLTYRKVLLTHNNTRLRDTFKIAEFFHQRGDSIFSYDYFHKKAIFQYKNAYQVGDSFKLQGRIDTFVYTYAVVFVDSLFQNEGVKRYACRMKVLPRRSGDTVTIYQFNIYDRFIPDFNWDLSLLADMNSYDGYIYKPLCFNDTRAIFKTPYFNGSCDSIIQPNIIVYNEPDVLSIFPNPANSHFTIKTAENQSITVRLININGVEVLYQKAASSFDLNVSHLPSGIYFIKAERADGLSIQHKVVIAH